MLFEDRFEAGRLLATRLRQFSGRHDVVVLALPRGGVPVGYEVAQALHAPLDVFVVRKLGTPGQEELAMGALAPGGITVLNREVIQALEIPQQIIDAAVGREQSELERREREYREGRPAADVKGRTVIVVDDGLATGSSMRVAARALRKEEARKIVVAVPVAARSTCEEFQGEVDELICAATPEPFWAVGQWYRNFSQTTDDEVRELLARAARHRLRVTDEARRQVDDDVAHFPAFGFAAFAHFEFEVDGEGSRVRSRLGDERSITVECSHARGAWHQTEVGLGRRRNQQGGDQHREGNEITADHLAPPRLRLAARLFACWINGHRHFQACLSIIPDVGMYLPGCAL